VKGKASDESNCSESLTKHDGNECELMEHFFPCAASDNMCVWHETNFFGSEHISRVKIEIDSVEKKQIFRTSSEATIKL
jgi:hypothetical protein